MREAGVPIPRGFDGTKQSFTLPGPKGCSQIGILLDTYLIIKKHWLLLASDVDKYHSTLASLSWFYRSLDTRWGCYFVVVRCLSDQIYVTKTINNPKGYQVNKSGGTTLSVKKRGGWPLCWPDAQVLAGWGDS